MAPVYVLDGQLDDEGVALLAASMGGGMIPTLGDKIFREKLTVPGGDRLRRHEAGDLHQCLAPEASALFRQTTMLVRVEPDMISLVWMFRC